MKTNRLLQIALTACLLCMAVTAYAQVTIGAGKEPETFSALELISNGDAGLRMPLLTTKERNEMAEAYKSDPDKNDLAKGLTIFNTTTNCLEFWNGKKWISQCEGECTLEPATIDPNASVSSCLPYMFTYQTIKLAADYAGGTPTTYQWAVDGKCVFGATNSTFAYMPGQTDLVLEEDALGNRKKNVKITCQMTVGEDVVQAADYEVLVVEAQLGQLSPIYVNAWSEAATASGSRNPDTDIIKVAYAHVNLGAEYELDPCEMLGDLYQWGRIADGHQRRSLTDTDVWPNGIGTPVTAATLDIAEIADLESITGQVLSSSKKYGKFIKVLASALADWRNPSKIDLWGDGEPNYSFQVYNPTWTIPSNNPCPTGWTVPSHKQWSAIYVGGTFTDFNPSTAGIKANTWTRLGTFEANSVSGYKLADVLFLPAAGGRNAQDGSVVNEGKVGQYTSCTSSGKNISYNVWLDKQYIMMSAGIRIIGQSIRCISK